MKKRLTGISILLIAVMISSCILTNQSGKQMKGLKDIVFIPSGGVKVEDQEVVIQAFLMYKYEVTNMQYREFLNDLKANGRHEDYTKSVVDSTKWNIPGRFCEPLVESYFNHPAYNSFPVVNVPYEGAELYCRWISEKLKSKGYNYTFRLPTREEWIFAALGGYSEVQYPWNSPSLISDKGRFMSNYKAIGDELISRNPENQKYEVTNDDLIRNKMAAFGTTKVGSYKHNAYGLYDMSGNVAEMVSEPGIALGGSWDCPGYDVRIRSRLPYDGPSPFVGFRPVATFTGN